MTPHPKIEAYYREKLRVHGPGPRGVDWPSAASQYLRFAQLVRICDFQAPFSLNDFGCGYGGLLTFLTQYRSDANVAYHGIDICSAMIDAANRLWGDVARADFTVGSACQRSADYSVASGVFNIRLGWPVQDWETYIEDVLRHLCNFSRIGFAVNFMQRDRSDEHEALYQTCPDRWIAFVETQLGRPADILTDYGLQEFTLLVRTN